jgi:uncharacterized protein involved in copper resistance
VKRMKKAAAATIALLALSAPIAVAGDHGKAVSEIAKAADFASGRAHGAAVSAEAKKQGALRSAEARAQGAAHAAAGKAKGVAASEPGRLRSEAAKS